MWPMLLWRNTLNIIPGSSATMGLNSPARTSENSSSGLRFSTFGYESTIQSQVVVSSASIVLYAKRAYRTKNCSTNSKPNESSEYGSNTNRERLHAGLWYLTPQDWLLERYEQRKQERKAKLDQGRLLRYQEYLKRCPSQSSCQKTSGGSAPLPPGFSPLGGSGSMGTIQPAGA